MSKSWRRGSTRAWRNLRAQILARDGHRCQLRIKGVCTTVATCAHHTRGKEHGDDPRYIVAACQPCNLRVGDPNTTTPGQQLVAWIRAQRAPVSWSACMRQFPGLHVNPLLARAMRRGEIIRVARGMYAAGPVEPYTVATADPDPQPKTRW